MRQFYILIAALFEIVILIVSSKLAAHYFASNTDLNPKSTSLLTLLFMVFILLGFSLCAAVVLIFQRKKVI
ncbi:hypothetical protein [Neobacillus terrae]|uniref:hypothetical protein n=1 Tax=Neobacillus terrae TaxID=3034837 RepID=UPI00140764F7|nr:hypothetical protein [Neobacillus terrae]NHM32919.1 hypothetical protein [Neobacillus terrae]